MDTYAYKKFDRNAAFTLRTPLSMAKSAFPRNFKTNKNADEEAVTFFVTKTHAKE